MHCRESVHPIVLIIGEARQDPMELPGSRSIILCMLANEILRPREHLDAFRQSDRSHVALDIFGNAGEVSSAAVRSVRSIWFPVHIARCSPCLDVEGRAF